VISAETVRASLTCAALAGSAVWLLGSSRPAGSRLSRVRRWPQSPPYAVIMQFRLVVHSLPVVAVGAAVTLITGYVVPLLVSPGVAALVWRWRRLAERRREAELRRADVRRFCVSLSAELRAGRPPREAAARAAGAGPAGGERALPGLASVGRAATSEGDLIGALRARLTQGADLTGALRAAGAQPGAEALRRVAACWQVAEHRGAGLADAIDRLVDGLHQEHSQRQEVAAQLSGARATALLLAALPAVGLLLGIGLGAHPLEVLLGTSYGLGCLLLGGALDVAGLVWMQRLVHAAEGGT